MEFKVRKVLKFVKVEKSLVSLTSYTFNFLLSTFYLNERRERG